MAQEGKLTVLAVGNGDSILIEAHGKTILIDIHYRKAAQDGDDDCLDIGTPIRAACKNDHLDIFVDTHPDKDHVSGFAELFHVGSPEDYDPNPKEGEPKIIVDEIWCSPYVIDGAYDTDCSKDFLKEVRRRHGLKGTDKANLPGNRLTVMDTSTHGAETVTAGLRCQLLAPTPDEVEQARGDGDDQPSSNCSSLVIRWAIDADEHENLLLTGGDSPFEVWERIWKANKKTPGLLAWEILVTPHHNSRHCLGSKDENDEFHFSDDAVNALSQHRGTSPRCVASSVAIKDDDNDPPSYQAKQKYLEILADGGKVDDDVKARFLCTGSHDDGEPGHVVIYFKKVGPTTKLGTTTKAAVGSSVGRGGGYGEDE